MHKLFIFLCALLLTLSVSAAETGQWTDLIDQQISAYNSNDADAYAAFFHEDIEVYNYPDQAITAGRGALVESTRKTFRDHKPASVILNRMALNDRVVTLERASYALAGTRRTTEVIKIYQFKDGLIRRMTFMY